MKNATWIIRAAAEVVACVLYYTGILFAIGLARKYFGRRRLLVMMYHHLAPAGPIGDQVHDMEEGLAPGHFAGHLRVLRWFGHIVPLETAPRALGHSRQRPRTLIALTFDDGYRDNLTVGLPELVKHRLPATLFPCLDPMEHGRRLWWDEVIRLVRAMPVQDGLVDASLVDGIDGIDLDITGPIERACLSTLLSEQLAMMPMSRRDVALRELRRRIEPDVAPTPPDDLYMNWDDLRHMADAGVDMGGHTVRHASLAMEPHEVARREIADSRRILSRRLGRPVTAFCYPGGYYDQTTRDLVEAAGYTVAVTVERGVNYADEDPLLYRRMGLAWEAPRHLALKLAFYGLVCMWRERQQRRAERQQSQPEPAASAA